MANDYWKCNQNMMSLFISLHVNAHISTAYKSARATEMYIASNASSRSKDAYKDIQNQKIVELRSKILQ